MGDLLAGTPATMMAFTAQSATVNDPGGALQARMEEGAAFQSAYEQAFARLQSFVAETNGRVADHMSDASSAGRSYLEADEVSATNLNVTDMQMPR
jgi:hypothetical protein